MSVLTEFLREQAQRFAQPDVQRQLKQWVDAENSLIRTLEGWLKGADPDGVLKIEKANHELREEKFGSYDAVSRMTVDLGGRRVEIVPRGGAVGGSTLLEDGQSAPIRGWVEMRNDIESYRLYRIANNGGDRWYLKRPLAGRSIPLEKDAFEAAIVELLK